MKKFFAAVAGVIGLISFALSRARYLVRAIDGQEGSEQ